MKQLLILRHAKAVPKDAAEDFDRALAARGRDQMGYVASFLANERIVPDQALVSPAARTRETWHRVKLPQVPVAFESRIYEATPETLIEVIRDAEPAARSVVLVGHNPGLHDLARELLGFGDRHAGVRRLAAFPTASLAILDLAVETWREADVRTGRLIRFETPGSLGMGGDE